MKTTGLTLAEALATGRPFKHRRWEHWSYEGPTWFQISIEDAYKPVWQVQEEEKPPMRVWTNNNYQMLVTSENPFEWNDGWEWKDITETLAASLAPYIKKELKL